MPAGGSGVASSRPAAAAALGQPSSVTRGGVAPEKWPPVPGHNVSTNPVTISVQPPSGPTQHYTLPPSASLTLNQTGTWTFSFPCQGAVNSRTITVP